MRSKLIPVADDTAEVAFRNIWKRMLIQGLAGYVEEIRLKTADRFFFRAKPEIMIELAQRASAGTWSSGPSSGGPHRMVYSVFPGPKPGDWSDAISYRSFERPSLQLTLQRRRNWVYGDADLDLGNPVMDLVGFFVHLVEVIVPGKTNHRKLEAKIQREYEEWLNRGRAIVEGRA